MVLERVEDHAFSERYFPELLVAFIT